MKKQISLNYETVKSLFAPEADIENGSSYFRINGGVSPATIWVPTSIMHRLFRLGQAYGIRQLRYLESEVKIVVGSVDVPEFISDLRKLRALINDEVLHEHIDKLLAEIESRSVSSIPSVAVSTDNYFK